MVTVTMPKMGELKPEHAILLGGAVLVPIGIGAYLILSKKDEVGEYMVSVEATEGGTTYPAPNTYNFETKTEVTFEAIPFEGYEFKGWHLDGVLHANPIITFTTTGQNLLIASFQKIDAPPLIPAYIKPIQNCVTEDWWKTWRTTDLLGQHVLHIGHDFYNAGFIKFKIADAAGNGVPNQNIAIYTDSMPDITDYGWLLLNDGVRRIDTPLILKSDANGVVSPRAEYQWWESGSDYRATIGTAGRIETTSYFGVSCGWHYPIWEGWTALFPCFTINRFERVKHPIIATRNFIHAYWVDNPSLIVHGDCYADCVVKIEGDKYY